MASRLAEIRRYLGVADGGLDSLIESCQAELDTLARPRSLSRVVLPAEHGDLCQGQDIARHLEGAVLWVLMAATLGEEVDRRIDRYQVSDLTRGLVLNACATASIEALCQRLEEDVREAGVAKNLFLGPRYSPGYGDYPLAVQPRLLQTLEAGRRLGLMCTKSFFLTPKKSVTALAPLNRTPTPTPASCDGCSQNHNCPYRGRR
jgi:hypothetical protein